MGMILRIASSRIVGQGDIVGRSGYFSLNLSANSVMRGRLDARRTLKSLVADLRIKNKKIKNSEDMTATANFRQMAQHIGLAICGLMMRTAFGVFGILWGIIREIVNGVFRVAIGVIVAILSTIAFFGFILWLFTL